MSQVCCPIIRQIGGELPGDTSMWSSNCRVGPFFRFSDETCDFGTKFCGIFRDTTTVKKLEAWVSTDMGFTWAVADASGFSTFATDLVSHDCVQDGDTIHVATKEATTGLVKYHTFDLATSTWTLVDEAVNGSGTDADTPLVTYQNAVSICVRSGGDIVIAYTSDKENVSGTDRARCLLRSRTAGVWSSAVALGRVGQAKDSILQRTIPGASNRVHVFMQMAPGGVASAIDDDVQTVASNNTAGTVNTWLTHGISGVAQYGRPFVYDDLSAFILPLRNSGQAVYYVFNDAANITAAASNTDLGLITQYGAFGSGAAAFIAGRPNGVNHALCLDWAFAGGDLWARYDGVTKASPYWTGGNNLQELDGQLLYINGNTWLFYFIGNPDGQNTFFFLLSTSTLTTVAATSFTDWITALPDQDSDYAQVCTGCTIAIVPGSSLEADSFVSNLKTSVEIPELFTLELSDVLEVALLPPPDAERLLEYVYVPYPGLVPTTPNGTAVEVPDDLTPFIKYGVLADLFGKSGETQDPIRQELCEQLWQLGVDVAKSWSSVR